MKSIFNKPLRACPAILPPVVKLLFLFPLLASCLSPIRSEAGAMETRMVAMRDGVRLATDVYLPDSDGPFPVILLRTPYNRSMGRDLGMNGVRSGYAVVIQDTRGRFGSEGENLPFHADGWGELGDGSDTIEWVARQSWCNGRIGTFGGSALGITQLQLAGSGTDKLTCQHITVATADLYEGGIYRGGVFRKALVEDWLRASQFSPRALEIWTSHSVYDDYWRARDVNTRLHHVHAPALHVGGYFDIFAQGTLDAFMAWQDAGGPGARGQQRLLMGPWTHGVLTGQAGELRFPNADSPPNRIHDHLAWFDHHLKGVSNHVVEAPAVTYYVMGDVTDPDAPGNEWRTADTWPPLPTEPTRFHLHADRTLSTQPPDGSGSITYTYDPRDPVPTVGGYELTLPAGPHDQRVIESRPDVLTFTSAPLEEPLEVIGRVRVRLKASTDGPDTDFLVKLCDVYPDGRSFNICEGILRARFRESLANPTLLEPGRVYAFDIDLWSTSIIFQRGHRLRVLVTSSSAPAYDPNPNTGEPFRASDRTRVARNTVHLSGASPSYLVLPVVRQP